MVSIRRSGQIAPNNVVCQEYLEGAEAVMMAYYSRTKTIAITPLPEQISHPKVYSLLWEGNNAEINASGFFKHNEIETEQTVRYKPEWDEDVTSEDLPGALLIDLRDDGEVWDRADPSPDDEPAVDAES
jgi:hypothetical protein